MRTLEELTKSGNNVGTMSVSVTSDEKGVGEGTYKTNNIMQSVILVQMI